MKVAAAGALEQVAFRREFRNYQRPDIASCPQVRTLYDVIPTDCTQGSVDTEVPSCLVFEWMETNLCSLPSYLWRDKHTMIRTILHSVLSALCVMKDLGAIHTGITCNRSSRKHTLTRDPDVNPNNILISNLDSCTPTAKLGDLGTSTSGVLVCSSR